MGIFTRLVQDKKTIGDHSNGVVAYRFDSSAADADLVAFGGYRYHYVRNHPHDS